MTQPISPLVADLLTASLTETQRVTNTVIDNLTRERDEARARINAIRDGVLDLLSGPWMPTSDALRSALYPTLDRDGVA